MEVPRSSQGRLEDDDWTKVKDAAERKKIQNRLAQRLHRKKYGRKKKSQPKVSRDESADVATSPSVVETPQDRLLRGNGGQLGDIARGSSLKEVDISFVDKMMSSSHASSSSGESSLTDFNTSRSLEPPNFLQTLKHPSPLTDTNFLILQTTHTITAMLFNASILKIACSEVRGRSIFIPPTLSTPKSLTPTPLQLTLPHWPYIDLLPLPALRNKLLQAHDIIDPRDIWQDLANGEVKVWGTQSWDERGWEITEPFARKWWFLMDEEVLGTTNFWRAARGEQGLDVGTLRRSLGKNVAS